MKNVIIYKSCYGHTRAYAQMLSKRFDFETYNIEEMSGFCIDCDLVIFLGWICNSEVQGLKQLKKVLGKISIKKLIVCGVGMTLIDDNYLQILKKKNILDKTVIADFFYLRGGYNVCMASKQHKKLMKVVIKTLVKRKSLDDNEKQILQMVSSGHDYVEESNLEDICQAIKKYQKV